MRIVNKKKFRKAVTSLILYVVSIIAIIYALVNFCKFPEKYLSTWSYQLQLDVAQGDEEAIAYYSEVYLQNDIKLWED